MKTPLPSEIYGIAPDGTELHWLVAMPSGTGPWPAALLVHVGGWRAGHPGPASVARDLAASGYMTFAIEYHLAPPARDMPQQVGLGYYPTQTEDVKMAIRAARNDSRCNGRVVGVGGSAGGAHVVYCCSTGTAGDDKFDVGVSLSGGYAFDDYQSLNDLKRKNWKYDVINYVNSSDLQALHNASPVNFVNPSMSWIQFFATNNDTMPPPQYDALLLELQGQEITNYTSRLISEPNQPDGFTRHAFEYWVDVKTEVLDFLSAHSVLANPTSSNVPPHPAEIYPYPKGVYTSFGGNKVPQEIINNKGIVGLGINKSWSLIETSDGVYDWTLLDAKLTNAKSVGFKYFILTVINSSWDTPAWLIQELKDLGETIPLLDLGPSHSTYCQVFDVPFYWSERWHAKRLALVEAFGARYSSDPTVIAVPASFANQNSMDWNIQDKVGFFCDQAVDQPAQWLAAGWTREKMLQVGKEMCDAVAAAFPKQNIKLPIGGTAQPLCGDGVYSTLAIEIVDYVKTRLYSNRFFIQRNTAQATWPLADDLIQHPPQPASDRYIRKMVLDASPLSGLQTIDYASRCIPGETCRQNGDQICTNASQVMQDSLNVMMSFNPGFIEVWGQDAKNRDFYTMIKSATTAIGGTPR